MINCDHSIGYLLANFPADEGEGSKFDLAADFADDETYAIFLSHHEMAKESRTTLGQLLTGMKARMNQLAGGES